MSWSDAIKDAVGNLVGEAEQAALPDLVKKVLGNEGLQSILAKLQDAGLQAQVSSWIDKNKTNLPITPEQIRTALGDEHVQQVAKSLGIPMDKVVDVLAKFLPAAASAAGPAVAPTACRRSINRDYTRYKLTGLEEADGAPAAGRTKIYLSYKRPIYLKRVQAISSIARYASRL